MDSPKVGSANRTTRTSPRLAERRSREPPRVPMKFAGGKVRGRNVHPSSPFSGSSSQTEATRRVQDQAVQTLVFGMPFYGFEDVDSGGEQSTTRGRGEERTSRGREVCCCLIPAVYAITAALTAIMIYNYVHE